MTAGAFGRCWEIWHTRKSKEQLLAENRRLRDDLKRAREDLDDTRYQLKLAVLAVDVVLDVARGLR